jgi:hypothetical protein
VNTTVDPGSVASAVDAINNAYDECRFLVRTWYMPIVGRTAIAPVTIAQNADVTVTAQPNPYNDKIVFTVTSKVAGAASFELIGLLGEKVARLYQGNIEKGAVKTFIYNAPATNRKTLIYQFRVGSEVVTGKVLYMN